MSSYTMQLREYIEQFSQDERMPVRNRIEEGRQHLFDFEYPFFDEDYRNVFETNFIRNFYMREIGFETEGLFKFQLETWLEINMPYYNKLFESELLQYDVLTNVNNKETYNRKNDRTQNDTTDKTGNVTSKDITHDEGTTTQSKTSHEDFDSTTNKTIDTTSQNDVTQHSTTDTSADHTGNQVSNGTSDSDTDSTSFNRDLTSDTPDSRLAITTNDGAGVIEYASEIKEGTSKSNQTNHTSTHNEVDETSHDTSTSTSDSKVDNDTTTHSTEKDTVTSDKDLTETINGSHSNDGTKDTNIDTVGNQKLNSAINNIEDYINTKTGKFGVVSYPQLVKEYRESLLRIEKQIFNEMNELFMLVY